MIQFIQSKLKLKLKIIVQIWKKHVQILRNKGFTNWGDGELYQYKININRPENQNPNYYSVTSIPEQIKYDKKESPAPTALFTPLSNDGILYISSLITAIKPVSEVVTIQFGML